jgi:hypothetical protein
MAKKKRSRSKIVKETRLNLGLWIVAFVLFIGFINSVYLLANKIFLVIKGSAPIGVYISIILLIAVLISSSYAVCLIMNKRKRAICSTKLSIILAAVFAFWYNLLANYIFLDNRQFSQIFYPKLMTFILDIIILGVVMLYIIKSKKIREILIK